MTNQGENENGTFLYNEDENISVFEDVQDDGDEARNEDGVGYYAWRGDYSNHDSANQSPFFGSMDEAMDWVREND